MRYQNETSSFIERPPCSLPGKFKTRGDVQWRFKPPKKRNFSHSAMDWFLISCGKLFETYFLFMEEKQAYSTIIQYRKAFYR